jgi:hypothetical protein
MNTITFLYIFSLGTIIEDIKDDQFKATRLCVFVRFFSLFIQLEIMFGFRGDFHISLRFF